jgi:hypothetical protein
MPPLQYILEYRSLAKEDLGPDNRPAFRRKCQAMVDTFVRPGAPCNLDLKKSKHVRMEGHVVGGQSLR